MCSRISLRIVLIDDHATMSQLGARASPAIEFELVVNRGDRVNDRSVVSAATGAS
jgi:hypothetical protein